MTNNNASKKSSTDTAEEPKLATVPAQVGSVAEETTEEVLTKVQQMKELCSKHRSKLVGLGAAGLVATAALVIRHRAQSTVDEDETTDEV